MYKSKIDRWMRQILETEAYEISCSDCLGQLDVYVEHERAGAPARAEMKQLKQHLGQCRVCHEEYEMLRALLEENGGNTRL